MAQDIRTASRAVTLDVRPGVVRVLRPDASTAGTGFLLSTDGLVITCSHVVQRETSQRHGESRPERVTVAYATGDRCEATVDPAYWRPVDDGDVAVLRAKGVLPPGVEPLALGRAVGTVGHPFRTFGFPDVSLEEGLVGDGHIAGETTFQGQRVLQLDSPQVTPGFSGAPVLDVLTGRVVGMVSSITPPDRYARQATTAFATPTDVLREVCPLLEASDICPYRSLEVFTEADAKLFFGRERAIEHLLDALRREPRFLAILGTSGSGKSSLVQAGLLPRLRAGNLPGSDRWGIVITRRADAPLEQLAQHGLPGADAGLASAVGVWRDQYPAASRLVLVLDQFEELLVACPPDRRTDFLAQLTALLEGPLPITVVLVMRDEFYGRLARQAPTLLPWIERGLVNVPPTLDREELRAVVQEPAEALGLRFEPGLVDAVVGDALVAAPPGEAPGHVARSTILPLLEFALTQLWEQREEGTLTHTAFRRIGGVTGGLAQWADRAYQDLAPELRPLARRVLTGLVHLDEEDESLPGSRRRRALTELARDEREQMAVDRVVRQLSGAETRLLVTARDPRSGQETTEVIHEALLREWGLLRRWLQEDRRFLLWRQEVERQAHSWMETACSDPARRDADRLLRGRDLDEAEGWLKDRAVDLGATERTFIEASVARREQERAARQREQAARERQRRRITLAAVVAALLFLVLAGLTGWQWRRAEGQRQIAEEQSRLAEEQSRLAVEQRNAAEQARQNAEYQQQIAEEQREAANQQAQIARSRQLAAQALLHLSDQRDLALLLSLEATRAADTVEARSSLLAGLTSSAQLVAFLRGHATNDYTARVRSVAYHPDGRLLASGSYDRSIILWDPSTRRAVHRLQVNDPVASVAFSPDGRTLAAGTASVGSGAGFSSSILAWDASTLQPMWPPAVGHAGFVRSVAFNPAGSVLASGSDDKTIRLWDARQGTPLREPGRGHTEGVTSVAFNPDGRLLVSGSRDRSVIIWDAVTLRAVGEPFTGHTGVVNAVAFSPDGTQVASAGGDGTIRLWDAAAHQLMARIDVGSPVHSVAFSRDGRTLAAGSLDRNIRIWDVATRQLLADPFSGHMFEVESVAFSPDGNQLASAGDFTVMLWNVASARPLIGHQGVINAVAFSPDGRTVASAGRDRTVRLWDVVDRRPLEPPLEGHTADVRTVAFSPDGRLLVSAGYDRTIRVWDVTTHELVEPPIMGAGLALVAYSPDGRTIVALGENEGIVLWDVTTRRPVSRLPLGRRVVLNSLTFSPDGRLLAAGGGVGSVFLWDVVSGQSLPSVTTRQTSTIETVAFSSDSKLLAAGSDDRTIVIVDVATRQALGPPLTGHTFPVTEVAFSPGGALLASASRDKAVRLWDVASRQALGAPLTGHSNYLEGLAISPDGRLLVSGGGDMALRVWDIDVAGWRSRICAVVGRNLTRVEWDRYLGPEPPRESCAGQP